MDPLDPAWAHCDSVKGLRSTMICRYCHKKISGGGITGFKYHLSGLKGQGSACKSVPEKVKTQMTRLIRGGPALSRKKAKKRKKIGNLTVAFLEAHVNSKKIKKDRGAPLSHSNKLIVKLVLLFYFHILFLLEAAPVIGGCSWSVFNLF
jgi:BED zinc finger